MNPRVSIIIPLFNREELVSQTLDSVAKQTYRNWECLVIDDGSTDNSREEVKKYVENERRISLHQRPLKRPKGANSCRNYGLEISQGDYVMWLDSDDILHPEKLERHLEVLLSTENKFCINQSLVFKLDISESIDLKSKKLYSDNIFEDFLAQRIIIPIQSPIFDKSFLISNDYKFDESLMAAQEWHFLAQILHKTNKFDVIDYPLDYIRIHSNNISNSENPRKYWHYYRARYKIYQQLKSKLSLRAITILEKDFLYLFKKLVRAKFFRRANKLWYRGLLYSKNLSGKDKLSLLIALYLKLFFNKGDSFLSGVRIN